MPRDLKIKPKGKFKKKSENERTNKINRKRWCNEKKQRAIEKKIKTNNKDQQEEFELIYISTTVVSCIQQKI